VAPFEGERMVELAALEAAEAEGGLADLDRLLLPLDRALPEWPGVALSAGAADRLAHRQIVPAHPPLPLGRARGYAPAGELLALGEVTAERRLVPLRVFAR
jgi:tRNA U55 pseudouridine synthase TruB